MRLDAPEEMPIGSASCHNLAQRGSSHLVEGLIRKLGRGDLILDRPLSLPVVEAIGTDGGRYRGCFPRGVFCRDGVETVLPRAKKCRVGDCHLPVLLPIACLQSKYVVCCLRSYSSYLNKDDVIVRHHDSDLAACVAMPVFPPGCPCLGIKREKRLLPPDVQGRSTNRQEQWHRTCRIANVCLLLPDEPAVLLIKCVYSREDGRIDQVARYADQYRWPPGIKSGAPQLFPVFRADGIEVVRFPVHYPVNDDERPFT